MRGFANILCVLQRIDDTDPAFARAVFLAELNQARLTVANVVPSLASASRTRMEIAEESSESVIDAQRERLESLIAPFRGRVEIEAKVVVGIGYVEVVKEVSQCDSLRKVGRYSMQIHIDKSASLMRSDGSPTDAVPIVGSHNIRLQRIRETRILRKWYSLSLRHS